jgi:CDP-glycerol glycerophosphotransferase (TagB/SpsB family)
VAFDQRQLRDLINLYLRNPQEDLEKQRQFVRDECTYTDGSASQRTAGFILSLLRTK